MRYKCSMSEYCLYILRAGPNYVRPRGAFRQHAGVVLQVIWLALPLPCRVQFFDKLDCVPFGELSVNALACLMFRMPATREPGELLDDSVGVCVDNPRFSNRKVDNN